VSAAPRGGLVAVVIALLLAACTGELTSPTEPLRLLASSLPPVYVGERIDLPLRPTGGLRPYTFRVVDGRLPTGMSVDAGRVAGTPTTEGRFAFTVEVSDASLNRTIQRFELLVRPLPVPELRVDAPATDVQRATPLVLRLESARGWRGAKVEVLWDEDAFDLDPDSIAAARPTVAALWEHGPGRLRVDVATLGDAVDGALDLVRFTLVPVESGPLGLTVAGEHRYAGGHHYASVREGSSALGPRRDPAAPGAPGGAAPGEPLPDPDPDAPPPDDPLPDDPDEEPDADPPLAEEP
jgi:hypothetical protein